jgi:hypothetical protein
MIPVNPNNVTAVSRRPPFQLLDPQVKWSFRDLDALGYPHDLGNYVFFYTRNSISLSLSINIRKNKY